MATWSTTGPRIFLAVSAAWGLLACNQGKPAQPPPAPAPAPETGSGTPVAFDLLDLPAETRVVIDARVPVLAASPVARRSIDVALSQDAPSRARLGALLARCRIDLARDVAGLTLAMKDAGEVALIGLGRFDEPALIECIRAEAGDLDEARSGSHVLHGTRGASPVWLTIGQGRVIAATSRAWLETVLAPGETLRARPEMKELIARADRGAALWGVGLMPPSAGERMVQLTDGEVKAPARAVSFQIDVGRDVPLAAQLRLEMADAADATKLAGFAGGQLGVLTIAAQRYGLGRLLAKTQIAAEGNGMIVSLRLDGDDVRLLDETLASRQAEEKKEQGR